jgi:hypothetical protein
MEFNDSGASKFHFDIEKHKMQDDSRVFSMYSKKSCPRFEMPDDEEDSGSEMSEEEVEQIFYDQLIEQVKIETQNQNLVIPRNTAIDKIIDRKCTICNSL